MGMEILGLVLLIAAVVFFVIFASNVLIANGMVSSGKYRKVNVPVLPLIAAGVCALLGVVLWR